MPAEIVVTKRSDDVHVCLKSNSGIWAARKTLDEALGNLIMSNKEHFGIEIAYNDDTHTQSWLKGGLAPDPRPSRCILY